MNEDGHHEEQHDDTAGTRIDFRYADGKEASMYVQLNSMSGQYFPFRPPPAPKPQSAEAEAAVPEEVEAAAAPQTRTYKAILTVEETVDANGEYQVTAHSPKLMEVGPQVRFLERMAQRQIQWEDVRRRRIGEGNTMLAISVRRQKKLRMKKKKYKKLMRRTRNERRKLDRI
jgi:hypothetical protein